MKVRSESIIIWHHGRKIVGRVYLPERDKCPVVICSHGFNGTGDSFRIYAEALAENGIAAFTYDFCGGSLYSKSDMTTEKMTVFTEKEDLLAVLDTVKTWANIDVRQISLFGESMGGLVSTLAAEERADEIKSMALLYPALCVADDWNERFQDVGDIPQTLDVWEVPLGRCFFETLHGFRIFEKIGNYAGDVLILHGDQDAVVPVEYSKKAKVIYQNARLEIFPGEGHGFSPAGCGKITQMLIKFFKV